MSVKQVVTAALLLFVGVTVVFVVIDVIREQSVATTTSEVVSETNLSFQPQVIVYYFHGKTRCPTCCAIEDQARETLQTQFADDLARGRIVWRVLDFSAPANKSLAKQFELYTAMVVLADGRTAPAIRWKCLEDVWTHVDDKLVFQEYIQTELRRFLEETR